MAKRFIPKGPFIWHNAKTGNRHPFSPDYIDPRDGLPGYRKLPKGMPKAVRDSFRVIEDNKPVVEAATAAPGETRAVKKPAAKKPAAKKAVKK